MIFNRTLLLLQRLMMKPTPCFVDSNRRGYTTLLHAYDHITAVVRPLKQTGSLHVLDELFSIVIFAFSLCLLVSLCKFNLLCNEAFKSHTNDVIFRL